MGPGLIEPTLANITHPLDYIVITVVQLWLKHLSREKEDVDNTVED